MKLNQSLAGFHLAIAGLYSFAIIFSFGLSFMEGQHHLDSIFIVILIIFVLIISLHAKAYVEVKKGTDLGRKLSKILGGILLLGFPVGTFVGWLILSYADDESWQSKDDKHPQNDQVKL